MDIISYGYYLNLSHRAVCVRESRPRHKDTVNNVPEGIIRFNYYSVVPINQAGGLYGRTSMFSF